MQEAVEIATYLLKGFSLLTHVLGQESVEIATYLLKGMSLLTTRERQPSQYLICCAATKRVEALSPSAGVSPSAGASGGAAIVDE